MAFLLVAMVMLTACAVPARKNPEPDRQSPVPRAAPEQPEVGAESSSSSIQHVPDFSEPKLIDPDLLLRLEAAAEEWHQKTRDERLVFRYVDETGETVVLGPALREDHIELLQVQLVLNGVRISESTPIAYVYGTQSRSERCARFVVDQTGQVSFLDEVNLGSDEPPIVNSSKLLRPEYIRHRLANCWTLDALYSCSLRWDGWASTRMATVEGKEPFGWHIEFISGGGLVLDPETGKRKSE